jgi:hypothetical protein
MRGRLNLQPVNVKVTFGFLQILAPFPPFSPGVGTEVRIAPALPRLVDI